MNEQINEWMNEWMNKLTALWIELYVWYWTLLPFNGLFGCQILEWHVLQDNWVVWGCM